MKRCKTLKHQQLLNIESGKADLSRVTARTLSELCEVLYPDIQPHHFVPETRLKVKCRSDADRAAIRRAQEKVQ